MEKSEEEPCIKCGVKIEDESIIYIREKVNGKWGDHPICTPCWDKRNPGIPAYRVSWRDV